MTHSINNLNNIFTQTPIHTQAAFQKKEVGNKISTADSFVQTGYEKSEMDGSIQRLRTNNLLSKAPSAISITFVNSIDSIAKNGIRYLEEI